MPEDPGLDTLPPSPGHLAPTTDPKKPKILSEHIITAENLGILCVLPIKGSLKTVLKIIKK